MYSSTWYVSVLCSALRFSTLLSFPAKRYFPSFFTVFFFREINEKAKAKKKKKKKVLQKHLEKVKMQKCLGGWALFWRKAPDCFLDRCQAGGHVMVVVGSLVIWSHEGDLKRDEKKYHLFSTWALRMKHQEQENRQGFLCSPPFFPSLISSMTSSFWQKVKVKVK